MIVVNVGRPLVGTSTLFSIRKLTVESNPLNVNNVGKPSSIVHTLLVIWEFIQGGNWNEGGNAFGWSSDPIEHKRTCIGKKHFGCSEWMVCSPSSTLIKTWKSTQWIDLIDVFSAWKPLDWVPPALFRISRFTLEEWWIWKKPTHVSERGTKGAQCSTTKLKTKVEP